MNWTVLGLDAAKHLTFEGVPLVELGGFIRWPLANRKQARRLELALKEIGDTRDDLRLPVTVRLPDDRVFGVLGACSFNLRFNLDTLPEA